jgi:NhaP-type Na+/H+ and K+/H+ antiporter
MAVAAPTAVGLRDRNRSIVVHATSVPAGASIVVALGAARTGLPVLVAFLGLGMLLGSDGPGGIAFDDAKLAREVGIVGLALILYEGGLQTSWRRLREVAVPAALLSTVGVIVTSVAFGAGHLLQGYDAAIATGLLGALWGVVYLRRRSAVAPMVSHAGFDLLQIVQFVTVRASGFRL